MWIVPGLLLLCSGSWWLWIEGLTTQVPQTDTTTLAQRSERPWEQTKQTVLPSDLTDVHLYDQTAPTDVMSKTDTFTDGSATHANKVNSDGNMYTQWSTSLRSLPHRQDPLDIMRHSAGPVNSFSAPEEQSSMNHPLLPKWASGQTKLSSTGEPPKGTEALSLWLLAVTTEQPLLNISLQGGPPKWQMAWPGGTQHSEMAKTTIPSPEGTRNALTPIEVLLKGLTGSTEFTRLHEVTTEAPRLSETVSESMTGPRGGTGISTVSPKHSETQSKDITGPTQSDRLYFLTGNDQSEAITGQSTFPGFHELTTETLLPKAEQSKHTTQLPETVRPHVLTHVLTTETPVAVEMLTEGITRLAEWLGPQILTTETPQARNELPEKISKSHIMTTETPKSKKWFSEGIIEPRMLVKSATLTTVASQHRDVLSEDTTEPEETIGPHLLTTDTLQRGNKLAIGNLGPSETLRPYMLTTESPQLSEDIKKPIGSAGPPVLTTEILRPKKTPPRATNGPAESHRPYVLTTDTPQLKKLSKVISGQTESAQLYILSTYTPKTSQMPSESDSGSVSLVKVTTGTPPSGDILSEGNWTLTEPARPPQMLNTEMLHPKDALSESTRGPKPPVRMTTESPVSPTFFLTTHNPSPSTALDIQKLVMSQSSTGELDLFVSQQDASLWNNGQDVHGGVLTSPSTTTLGLKDGIQTSGARVSGSRKKHQSETQSPSTSITWPARGLRGSTTEDTRMWPLNDPTPAGHNIPAGELSTSKPDAQVLIVEDEMPSIQGDTITVPSWLILDTQGLHPDLHHPDSMTFADFLADFHIKVDPYYKRIPGFQKLVISGLSINDSAVLLRCSLACQTQQLLPWLGSLDTLLDATGLQAAIGRGLSVHGLRVVRAAISHSLLDLCATVFQCQPGFYCIQDKQGTTRCTSLCYRSYCKNGGICIHRPGQQPACQCPVGDDYWFTGAHCDHRMTQQDLTAMSVVGLLGLAAIMATITCLIIRKVRELLQRSKVDQTRSSYLRFSQFDDLSDHFCAQSWLSDYIGTLENPVFSSMEDKVQLPAEDSSPKSTSEGQGRKAGLSQAHGNCNGCEDIELVNIVKSLTV
ncbi:mucin-6 [Erpetoichthys calabaricus]|uniref:mucin-6 n=1 Tax=Erpetoichthys calabaricus TaxID=27687 RepID=UPI002233E5D4|nr:mucin-6 [Erpetoichthys calabaricus]